MASTSRKWTGWVVFAGAMLLIVGMINIYEGLIALIKDEHLVETAQDFVVVDLTSFGWILLLSGLLMVAVAVGLITAQTWARIAAVVIVCLHAVAQISWLEAYPFYALLMIALDTVVLFALTAKWSEAEKGLGDTGYA
jgi:hypothetical protein